MILNRRQLLGLLSSGTFLLSAGMQAAIKLTGSPQRLRFPQGVASGDPQPDGVMLWTRAEPANIGCKYRGQTTFSYFLKKNVVCPLFPLRIRAPA